MKKSLSILAAACLSFAASASDGVNLNRFLPTVSPNYAVEEFGKAMPKFNLSERSNSEALAGTPFMLVFWEPDDAGNALIKTVDSLRSKGRIALPIVAVNYKSTPEETAAYKKAKKIRFDMPAGKDAAKLTKKLKAGNGTVIIADADGKIRNRWNNITPREFRNWIGTAIWDLDAGDDDFKFETLGTCFSTNDYATGLFIGSILPWNNDGEMFDKYYFSYLIFCTWGDSDMSLDFAKKVYDRYTKVYKDDRQKYMQMLNNISYELSGCRNASPELCRFALERYDELIALEPARKTDFVTTDRIRLLNEMLGTDRATLKAMAEKAMREAHEFEAKGTPMHPDTYMYLQKCIDKYN